MIWLILGYLLCGIVVGRICATTAYKRGAVEDAVQTAAFFGVILWPVAVAFGLCIGLSRVVTWRLPEPHGRHHRTGRPALGGRR
jgi:hypothetical protein